MSNIETESIFKAEAADNKVSELFSCLKLIDKSPFGKPELNQAFIVATKTGKISFFALECISSYPEATAQGVGKVPIGDPAKMPEYSTAFYNAKAVQHLVKKCHSLGIDVNYHVFLGDDDYLHSVDTPWQATNPAIADALEFQKEYFLNTLPDTYSLTGEDTLSVHSWLEIEATVDKVNLARDQICKYIMEAIAGNKNIPGPVSTRLHDFLNWRIASTKSAGVLADEKHLLHLAIQELSSFACQGHVAPLFVEAEGAPIVQINTMPGNNYADDLCVRLGSQWVGLKGTSFGTIHPSTSLLESKLAPKTKTAGKRMVLTCGDPKGNKNW